MKQMTEYNRVCGYLNKIFTMLNETYFENELSKPVITIQSTPKAYGHVSCGKVWNSDGEDRHELNIGAGTLARPIEQTVATMLHEMVHLWNMHKSIKDTSRGCTYHNTKFRDEAVKRDLIIEHHPTYGWTITTPSDTLIQWCIDRELEEIKVSRFDGLRIAPPTDDDEDDDRHGGTTTPPIAKKVSSSRKYVCPCCGVSVRATRTVDIICGECYTKDSSLHHMIAIG